MVFINDDLSRKVIATIGQEGAPQRYECAIFCCEKPVCRCSIVVLDLTPIGDPQGGSRRFGIDFSKKSLVNQEKNRLNSADLQFAEDFVASLSDSDYQFLAEKNFISKHSLTEEMDISLIKVDFDFTAMEQNGDMLAYNDVLPYGDQLLFTIIGKKWIILDQYCLQPKCSCTEIVLSFSLIKDQARRQKATSSFWLDYKKKKWTPIENEPFPVDVEALRSTIEAQLPDFYEALANRHKKLKKIYANSKKKPPGQPIHLAKVGRNDSCPCGSGKKYKKCCMVT